MKNILVTGGAGFIGSHTCVELLNNNYNVIVVDNFSNSCLDPIKRIELLTNKKINLYNCDIRDKDMLKKVFSENKIDAVIHFAGLKSIKESLEDPIKYFDNNVSGTINLCKVMNDFGVKKLVFSSSATVYGQGEGAPYNETMQIGEVTNPYGRTKVMLEEILTDIYNSDKEWSISLLRYFNPIGAHESGLIGEDPSGIPCNIMPYISQVSVGKLPCLTIFGDDYNTEDGTCIRDYIHVVDLARGHICALERVLKHSGLDIFNLGTGKGVSVLELVHTFEKASGKKINYVFGERRKGDLPIVYADPSKAKEILNFETKFDIYKMCEDSFRWQSKNPNGYQK